MRTLQTVISDAAIKRHLADDSVYQLKDPRFSLYLRYNKARTGGSWLLVHYAKGKQVRAKIGAWPLMPSNQIIQSLPKMVAGEVTVTINQVCDWYLGVLDARRDLSKKRKIQLKSTITRHLKPKLGDCKVSEISISLIRGKLVDDSVSLSRSNFSALKKIMNSATKGQLGLKDENNPLSKMYFSEICPESAPSKEAEEGYIYALTNPCMPGLFKIGLTKTPVEDRRKSLSASTSCPVPFDIYRVVTISNVKRTNKAEADIHNLLKHCRVNPQREFFKPDNVGEIDLALEEIQRRYCVQ